MPMSPRLLRPVASGFHPEAQVWRNAVIANGGSVSGSTLNAVSRFCRSIDAAGLRNRFYRLNLFCGTGLNAALVPLYRAESISASPIGNPTDTNINFVSGDYVETGSSTGGLKGDGTSKYLNTGLNPNSAGLTNDNVHVSAYVRGTEAAGTTRKIISNIATGSGNGPMLGWTNTGSTERFATAAANVGPSGAQEGLLGGNGTSAGTAYYVNGTDVASSATVNSNLTTNAVLFVFAGNSAGNPVFYALARYFCAYSIGQGLSASQWSSFNAAMLSFQQALSRSL
jgi:hypothetical protein